MSPELISALIGGVTALLAALLTRLPQFFRDGRASLSKDLEVYNALPAESSQKEQLLSRIDQQLRALGLRRDARRDWWGIAQALFLMVAGGAFLLAAIGAGGGWLLTVVPSLGLLLLALLGLLHSVPRRVRDVRGNPVGGPKVSRAPAE
ncbi:hypothetical protein PTW37_10020 [Arthrobacter agilis]|uniref:hypothetical protein n=1 Tax=Arthrobacter agilis TaxID=37921 RepID=UPI00236608DE|nr:hypothetical protein [Arthrobacter agilis]WDF32212.1 hypothetical protein PTW37_10020 [Arthrobacter agilis]